MIWRICYPGELTYNAHPPFVPYVQIVLQKHSISNFKSLFHTLCSWSTSRYTEQLKTYVDEWFVADILKREQRKSFQVVQFILFHQCRPVDTVSIKDWAGWGYNLMKRLHLKIPSKSIFNLAPNYGVGNEIISAMDMCKKPSLAITNTLEGIQSNLPITTNPVIQAQVYILLLI